MTAVENFSFEQSVLSAQRDLKYWLAVLDFKDVLEHLVFLRAILHARYCSLRRCLRTTATMQALGKFHACLMHMESQLRKPDLGAALRLLRIAETVSLFDLSRLPEHADEQAVAADAFLHQVSWQFTKVQTRLWDKAIEAETQVVLPSALDYIDLSQYE